MTLPVYRPVPLELAGIAEIRPTPSRCGPPRLPMRYGPICETHWLRYGATAGVGQCRGCPHTPGGTP